jgi:hypothetical protein
VRQAPQDAFLESLVAQCNPSSNEKDKHELRAEDEFDRVEREIMTEKVVLGVKW